MTAAEKTRAAIDALVTASIDPAVEAEFEAGDGALVNKVIGMLLFIADDLEESATV